MFGLGSNKKSITREQALAAKPVPTVSCELIDTPDGGAKLKVKLKQSQGFVGRLFRVPEGATKTFELDVLGRFVWIHCDGKTSVQQIIRKLSKDQNLTLREVEVSTIQFLQMLVRKGLVGMSVDKESEGKE